MRARWLKPEFFTDKKIAALGPIPALVYQALWCMADDGGTAQCDPDTIKAQMFYRWSAVGVPEITEAVRHLSGTSRIVVFQVGDDTFATIEAWDKHQKVHKPSSFRYPDISQGVICRVPEWCGTSAAPLPASPPPRHLDSYTPRHQDTKTPTGVAGQAQEPDYHAEFAALRAVYPKREGAQGWPVAEERYIAHRKRGVEFAGIERGVLAYADLMDKKVAGGNGTGSDKVCQAQTFFGPQRRWEEQYTAAQQPAENARHAAADEKYYAELMAEKALNGYANFGGTR